MTVGCDSDGMSVVLWLLFVGFIRAQLPSQSHNVFIGYDQLYTSGIIAYDQQHWFECSSLMNRAISARRVYWDGVVECRSECAVLHSFVGIAPENLLDPLYVYRASQRSKCIDDCKRLKFGGQADVPFNAELEDAFNSLMPYDYLQMCAYKSEQYELAISAAFTVLSANPDHPRMKDNVNFYTSLPEAMPSYFVNLEAKPYQELYQQGVEAYYDEDWLASVQYVEQSIPEYFKEYRRCLAFCDYPYDQQSFTKLHQQIINSNVASRDKLLLDHWSTRLQCRLGCDGKVNVVNASSEPLDDYFVERYNFLQFAYHKLGNSPQAAQCTSTYLLFRPNDETMLQNKNYYMSQSTASQSDFTPRQDAAEFFNEREKDDAFFKAVVKKLSASQDSAAGSAAEPSIFEAWDDASYNEMEAYLAKYDIEILSASEEDGRHHVAADGLLADEHCAHLIQLDSAVAPDNDFSRLTVSRAAELARDGAVSSEQVRAYLQYSDVMRVFLKKYFNIQMPLHYQSTQLICQSAQPGAVPANVDCFPQADGSCTNNGDIVGLLYLNDDFEGGDFYFTTENLSTQQLVKPRCGRLIGFESSVYHGMTPIKSGRRCVLLISFTVNYNLRELAHLQAETLLRGLDSTRPTYSRELQTLLDRRGYSIVMTEEELNGPERFAADNILTEAQCQRLMKLANDGGVAGEGYQSRTSPHTKHELFVGLSLSLAQELVTDDKVEMDDVRLYMDASEAAKDFVGRYFNKDLYFDYTHLVCRTALDENVDRTDLSHPIHSDNCIIQPDNTCKREPPAYTSRDYSALVYLNSDFVGGNFFFTHQNMSLQSSVMPKCGRMVGFNASNYHGVQAVQSGQRCAMAMWMTLDPTHREHAHDTLRQVLDGLEATRSSEPRDEL